jgi:hypothetical protein
MTNIQTNEKKGRRDVQSWQGREIIGVIQKYNKSIRLLFCFNSFFLFFFFVLCVCQLLLLSGFLWKSPSTTKSVDNQWHKRVSQSVMMNHGYFFIWFVLMQFGWFFSFFFLCTYYVWLIMDSSDNDWPCHRPRGEKHAYHAYVYI